MLNENLSLQAEALVIVELQNDVVSLLESRGADLWLRVLPEELGPCVNVLVREQMHQELKLRVHVSVEVLLRLFLVVRLRLHDFTESVQFGKDVELEGILVQKHLRVEEAELAQFHGQVL